MYLAQRRYGESEQLALRAYPAMLDSVGPTHQRTVRIMQVLADLYDAWGQPQKAAEWRAKLPNKPSTNQATR